MTIKNTKRIPSQPKVSVIMNCLNGDKYLRAALDSVFAQTYLYWEIIFWDNNSKDRSAQIAKSYGDRIHYFKSPKTIPLGEARNKAISKATGYFLAFLDCDDLWLPEKLATQIPLFLADPTVGIVISDTVFFSDDGYAKQLYRKKKPPVGNVFRQLLEGNFISLETVILRKSALNDLAELFDTRFNAIEEYDLFIRLCHQWNLAYADQVLGKWRVHSESWTWKKAHLFGDEFQLLIQKLSELYPDFDTTYKSERTALEQKALWLKAHELWKKGDRGEASALMRTIRFAGLKWFLLYVLTHFPYSLFKLINKLLKRPYA